MSLSPFNFITCILLLIPILQFPTVTSDSRATPAGNLTCGSGGAPDVTFIPTFVQAMERLSRSLNNSNNNFAITDAVTVVPDSPRFYALIQCHNDLSRNDCLVCYAVSRTALPGCLPRTSGRVFLDGCFVRYDNYSFFQESVDPLTDARSCNSSLTHNNWDDFEGGFGEFNRSVVELVENITRLAPDNSGFSVLELNGVYGLGQCWQSLSNEGCSVCLNKAKDEAIGCLPSREARSMNAGCFLRYSTNKFFNNDDAIAQAVGGNSGFKGTMRKLLVGISCSIMGIIFLIFVILCRKKKLCIIPKRREAGNDQIEIFIRNYGNLAPKRYQYSEIKIMTNSFLKKLGRGGYGSVYKGQLPDGRLVAVKLLNEATGNGQDFINEVASISRTSHVNIVTLLGFCFKGNKRALLYEYMPNGSLDRFIRGDGFHLDWNTLFQIAKGIARGLDYLHRGCNTRIVHFDIKPHNILLDDEFVPKISDFGLAKLCKKKESIVSVTGARGTVGYMAPEVYFRSLGGPSHKSDVYSYGMMVLEMAGARNHDKAKKPSTSESYFPDWIYTQVEAGSNLADYGVTTEEEEELARKMMMVSLWCIQSNPSDRPSISKVVEMLEGSFESLQAPPRRFESSPEKPFQGTPSSTTQSSSSERVSTLHENVSLPKSRKASY